MREQKRFTFHVFTVSRLKKSYTESTMNKIIERFIKQQQYRSRNRSTAEHYMSDLRIFQRYIVSSQFFVVAEKLM
jgi:hypothetical protein